MALPEVVPAALLDLLPHATKNMHCICKQCIQDFVSDPHAFTQRFAHL